MFNKDIKELLIKDKMVVTKIKGKSMQPFLYDGDKVIISKKDNYDLYDICLFEYKYHYLLHRLIKIDGNKYIFKGDNNISYETVNKDSILGVLSLVYKDKGSIVLNEEINKKNYNKSLLLKPFVYLNAFFCKLINYKYRFVIKIAGLYIKINSYYDYTYLMCRDYIVDKYDHIDIDISYSKKDIDLFSFKALKDYKEFIYIYDLIAGELYKFNRLLIHGAAISYNNNAYIFVGDSGIGKTTHTKLLKDNFDGIDYINGDKPIIDNNGFVYGTPWSGKENYNSNISYKLKSIIFVNRSDKNSVILLNKKDCIKEVLDHIYKDKCLNQNIDILNKSLKDVSFYNLYCDISFDAAKVTFDNILNNQ